MADFVSNFVAMATWVGPFKICLTSLDSLIPKPPVRRTNLGDISLIQAELQPIFFLKFRCHGNGDWSW